MLSSSPLTAVSKLVLFVVVSLFFLAIVPRVLAQGLEIEPGETLIQPKTRTTKVTAGVHDTEAPSTPILIAPTNGSTVVTNTPSFVWKESVDNFAVQKYELILDGVTYFSPIPLTTTETTEFKLTYSDTTKEYTLVPKSGLTEGSHSWKIVAYDFYNNQTSSVTWTFTIDSRAPIFVITTIDITKVSISAQDLSTVPENPVVSTTIEPILKGTGEAGSAVRLTIRDGSTADSVLTFSIGSDGSWTQQLTRIPRDIVIYLDFLITDQAGNISALEDVPIIVYSKEVVIPIPDTPIVITLPIMSAVEIKEKIVSSVISYAPPTVQQLLSAAGPVRSSAKPIARDWLEFFKYAGIVILLLHPLIKTFLLAYPFGFRLSFSTLRNIWRALGILSDTTPQGIVVDSATQRAIPFAPLRLSGTETNKLPYHAETVTNKEGIFFRLDIPAGTFAYTLTEHGCIFPTLQMHPEHLGEAQYYQGTQIEIDEQKPEPLLCIPVDCTEKYHEKSIVKQWLLDAPLLNAPVTVGCFILVFLNPSLINAGTLMVYSALYLWKKMRSHGHTLERQYHTKSGTPTASSIIISVRDDKSHADAIQQTDHTGTVQIRTRSSSTIQYIDFKHTVDLTQSGTSDVNQVVIPSPKVINFVR